LIWRRVARLGELGIGGEHEWSPVSSLAALEMLAQDSFVDQQATVSGSRGVGALVVLVSL